MWIGISPIFLDDEGYLMISNDDRYNPALRYLSIIIFMFFKELFI